MMRPVPYRRPAAVALAVAMSLLAMAGAAAAHAELETATPADGAIVTGQPPEISGVYSEDMDPDGSSLKLVDASGAQVATGGVLAGDVTKMAIDPVPELAPGAYTVESTTKSADDGDIDRTKWIFTVTEAAVTSAPASSATVTPSASPSDAPSATGSAPSKPTATPPASTSPAPSSSPDTGSSTGSGGDVLLPIAAAVVILVAIGGFLYSRRDRSDPNPP